MSKIKRRRRRMNQFKIVAVFVAFVVIATITITLLINHFSPHIYYNYDFEQGPPLISLTPSSLKAQNFYNDPYLRYEDEHYTSKVGIDVSSHQKEIDFEKVKKSGVDFVYLRYGYRGYSEGGLHKDSYFEKNYKNAKKAGLEVGVYFFSQAISPLEAMDEAYFLLDGILNKEIDLPIVYDLESIDYDESRIDSTTDEERTTNALAFCQKIIENSYDAAIYTNLHWSEEVYDLHQISKYPIWMAQYANELNYPYETYIWQYTDQGEVEGVATPVDLNVMFIKK